MTTFESVVYYEPDEILELAKACMVGLASNFEAPHHKPRELAARAFDYAQAFYDELDVRTAAAEAKESESSPTEPPPSALSVNAVEPDEIDEDPEPEQLTQIARVWTDLERASQG